MIINIKHVLFMDTKWKKQPSKRTLKFNDIIAYENNFMCTPSKRMLFVQYYDIIATIIPFTC